MYACGADGGRSCVRSRNYQNFLGMGLYSRAFPLGVELQMLGSGGSHVPQKCLHGCGLIVAIIFMPADLSKR